MSGPLTFGYVRVATAHKSRVERWRRRIGDYCRQEGLALELVFADLAVPSTQSLRPGWIALLDVLALRAAQTVIVPSNDHLSRDLELQAELRAQVADLGASVVAIPRTTARLRQRASDG